MTRLGILRIAAGAAAIITALLLQGGIVAPLFAPAQISLPVVLVAAVALIDGPGVGMALGFSAGLLADLTSDHAAGVLALAWLLVGLICGLFAVPHIARGLAGLPPAPVRYILARGALIAGLTCALATLAAQLFLVVVGQDGATLADSFAHLLPAFAGDMLLAIALVPWARFMLTRGQLRAVSAVNPNAAPVAGSAEPSLALARGWYG